MKLEWCAPNQIGYSDIASVSGTVTSVDVLCARGTPDPEVMVRVGRQRKFRPLPAEVKAGQKVTFLLQFPEAQP